MHPKASVGRRCFTPPRWIKALTWVISAVDSLEADLAYPQLGWRTPSHSSRTPLIRARASAWLKRRSTFAKDVSDAIDDAVEANIVVSCSKTNRVQKPAKFFRRVDTHSYSIQDGLNIGSVE